MLTRLPVSCHRGTESGVYIDNVRECENKAIFTSHSLLISSHWLLIEKCNC